MSTISMPHPATNQRGTTEVPLQSELFCFGEYAEYYAKRLPQGLSAVLCDGSYAAEALAKGVELRRKGIPFLFFPLIDDTRAQVARHMAQLILGSHTDPDQLRSLFESLAAGAIMNDGKSMNEFSLYDWGVIRTLSDLAMVADGVVFRSQTERNAIEAQLFIQRPFAMVAPFGDISIPNTVPDAEASRIVVWAPHESASRLALYAYALSDFKIPAIFVCHDSIPGSTHTFVPPSQAEFALRQAAVVVDTHLSDPGVAIAFAERGYGIVASHTSGAHEFVQGIGTYNPSNFLDIAGAVGRVRSMRRTRVVALQQTLADFQNLLDFSVNPMPKDTPLVSIVVPTYNRPHYIRKQLESFSRQTYPNFEVIIVNDGGESVEDIVAEYPFARYICAPENRGCGQAHYLGNKHARGEYIGSIPDDDLQYPNHIKDCVVAFQSSKLDVAYANVLSRISSRQSGGSLVTTGHTLTFRDDFDRTKSLYFHSVVTNVGFLMKRSVEATIPTELRDRFINHCDPLLWLYLSQNHDFCHVDRVNTEFNVRNDGSTITSRSDFEPRTFAERKDILAYFLPPNRPLIEERQKISLANLEAHGTQPSAPLQLTTPLEGI